jgi:hypothetical protein
MASLGGILGNPFLSQLLLYNVVGQLVGAGLAPFMTILTNEVNQATPAVPLPPAAMADAVIRNIVDEGAGAAEAAFAGVNSTRFHQLVELAGNAPDPTSLAVALRRKLIDGETYDRGIRQGRLRDEWGPLVRELAVVQPAPGAMLSAYLEGQLVEGEARDRYAQLGGDPDYFDILFHTEGQAPTPTQALEMANRGIIGWSGQGPAAVSFEQAFLEGPWRNKWAGAFRALGAYLPPPRTVTAMHREGALSTAEATQLLEHQGLTPDLARAYLTASSKQKVAKVKDLAESTILTLYRDRLIPAATARTFLEGHGYDATEAAYILAVEDLRVAESFMRAGVSRIHTLYVGHKIDAGEATAALAGYQLDATAAGELVALWGHERAVNHRPLTPAQIEAAFGLDILTQDQATAALVDEGYTPHDAWTLLSIHHKAALPGEPAPGALGPAAGP